jgi:hypothetical protein
MGRKGSLSPRYTKARDLGCAGSVHCTDTAETRSCSSPGLGCYTRAVHRTGQPVGLMNRFAQSVPKRGGVAIRHQLLRKLLLDGRLQTAYR